MGPYNNVLLIRTLSRTVCEIFRISVGYLDLSGSPIIKYSTFFRKLIWDFVMTFCWYKLYLVPFARYSASNISVCDLDLSVSLKVKYFNFFRKPIWDFIMMFCWYELSILYRLRDLPHLRFRIVTLTFQSHQRSIISHFLRSQCATLSKSLFDTNSLVPFARYSASKISVIDLDLPGSPKFKYFTFFGKPVCNFVMVSCWYKLFISYCLRDISNLTFFI